jgi:hypothetical protein
VQLGASVVKFFSILSLLLDKIAGFSIIMGQFSLNSGGKL